MAILTGPAPLPGASRAGMRRDTAKRVMLVAFAARSVVPAAVVVVAPLSDGFL
jgi:hypothetical protein